MVNDGHGITKRRAGFTLVECCAALFVLAALVLTWQPIVQAARQLVPNDQQTVEALAMERQLDRLAGRGRVAVKDDDSLVITVAKTGKKYLINHLAAGKNGPLILMTTSSGGYMPLLKGALGLRVQQLKPGVVHYQVLLPKQIKYEGVLIDGIKAETEPAVGERNGD